MSPAGSMTSARRRLGRWVYSTVVYRAAVLVRREGALFRHLGELAEAQWLSPEDLARRRAGRIADIINYARHRCPYYRTRWPCTGLVTDEDAVAQLGALPFLTKAELQTSVGELLAQPPVRPVSHKITGGSTGEPVTVVKDRAATSYERAVMWLGYGWFGVDIGDRAARFWGFPLRSGGRLQSRIADLAMHRVRFPAFAFDEADLENYWRRCLRFQPDYFHGYVSMLETFARFLEARGYDGTRLGLKSVIVTAEVLAQPQRSLLERVFGTRVQVEYGCGEVGPIAYECERGSLHAMTENDALEIVTPEGRPAVPGETGEVVVTDLHNRAMPLVRYRLGDFAVPGTACACGRGFPVIQKIWGREYDFVRAPDGKRYHGEFFMYLFEDLRRDGLPVQQFQVIQRVPGGVEVAVVVARELADAATAEIRDRISSRVEGMRVAVRRVDAIARAASGKMQVIKNTWLRGPEGEMEQRHEP